MEEFTVPVLIDLGPTSELGFDEFWAATKQMGLQWDRDESGDIIAFDLPSASEILR